MLRPIQQLHRLHQHYSETDERGYVKHPIPIICSGDIFDRWNAPAELINFLLQHLPVLHAIPGQHDLPYHSHELLHKSAYWTLVKAGKIISLHPKEPKVFDRFTLVGFSWGVDIEPFPNPHSLHLQVAAVHAYVWKEGYQYPGAPLHGHVRKLRQKLKGYDVALFGDNHIPFTSAVRHKCFIYNNGSFLRRTMKEVDLRPAIGLLLANGTVKRYYLDCSADVFPEVQLNGSDLPDPGDMRTFAQDLAKMTDTTINFTDAIKRYLNDNKVNKQVRRLLLKMLETL